MLLWNIGQGIYPCVYLGFFLVWYFVPICCSLCCVVLLCWSGLLEPWFGSFLPLLVLFAGLTFFVGLLPLVSGCWALFYGLCGSFPYWEACFGFGLLGCGSLDVVLVLPL
jgi:hypothetical protein